MEDDVSLRLLRRRRSGNRRRGSAFAPPVALSIETPCADARAQFVIGPGPAPVQTASIQIINLSLWNNDARRPFSVGNPERNAQC